MCRPDYFDVVYRINPWMNPRYPTDTSRALRQWETLLEVYRQPGHTIEFIDPIPGLPDTVYAANGGSVAGGTAYGAAFTYPERRAEGPAYMDWFSAHGFSVGVPEEVNDGEGDFLLGGGVKCCTLELRR